PVGAAPALPASAGLVSDLGVTEPAAVYAHGLAGHETALLGEQEEGDACDLLRTAEPAERRPPLDRGAVDLAGGDELVRGIGGDEAGSDAVHPDACRRELDRRDGGELDDGGLR